MNNVKTSFFVAAAVLSVAALAPNASARGLGGYGGKADSGSQTSSFSEVWNSVMYNGTGTARWDIPLVIDAVGSLTPTVYAFVSGASSNVSCTAQAVSQDESFISSTGWFSPSVGNAWTSVALPTVRTVTNGSAEVACFIGTNSRIQTVTW
jgi:hypothetical protein